MMANHWTELIARQTWQIALLAMLVWGVTGVLQDKHQHLKYALWLLVILKCATPPFVSSPVSVYGWLEKQVAVCSQEVNLPLLRRGRSAAHKSFQVSAGELNKSVPQPSNIDTNTGNTTVDHDKFQHGVSVFSSQILLYVWAAGVVTIGVIACLRVLMFLRRIRSTSEVESLPLIRKVDELSNRLHLRNKVRLRITKERVGPAVYGLSCPTIVLPELLVKESTVDDLVPILTHELLHVRRGDLWVNLLRTISTTLWWFNPLVWFSASKVSNSAEVCCDEETVAAMDYDGESYARALVHVLELKHRLVATPAFPGIRPFEVTARRLKRIMRMKANVRQRAPVWCWVIIMVLGMLVLPATRGTAQNPKSALTPSEKYDTKEPQSFDSFLDLPLSECISIGLKNSRLVRSITTDSGDAITQVKIALPIDLAKAKSAVASNIHAIQHSYWELYFFYHNLRASREGRDESLELLKQTQSLFEEGAIGGEVERLAQAKEQYFFFQGRIEQAEKDLFKSEGRLRNLLGLAKEDGRMIRPLDQLETKRAPLDWEQLTKRALDGSLEVHSNREKVANLEAQQVEEARTPSSDYNFRMSLARERARLENVELEAIHQLTKTMLEIDAKRRLVLTNSNCKNAAKEQLTVIIAAYRSGNIQLDLVLDGIRRKADADTSWAQAYVDLKISNSSLRLKTGEVIEGIVIRVPKKT